MEGSHSGKRPWRIASKAETSSGQWKPSISEYTCIRVNGGRYSSQKRYVAGAATATIVLVRRVLNNHPPTSDVGPVTIRRCLTAPQAFRSQYSIHKEAPNGREFFQLSVSSELVHGERTGAVSSGS